MIAFLDDHLVLTFLASVVLGAWLSRAWAFLIRLLVRRSAAQDPDYFSVVAAAMAALAASAATAQTVVRRKQDWSPRDEFYSVPRVYFVKNDDDGA